MRCISRASGARRRCWRPTSAPIPSWQRKRDGERNEALDTFGYAHAALHGPISMGLPLNEEVGRKARRNFGSEGAAVVHAVGMGLELSMVYIHAGCPRTY